MYFPRDTGIIQGEGDQNHQYIERRIFMADENKVILVEVLQGTQVATGG
ncbi:MAG: hypothetical protein NTV45_03435 [Firmicutes bacterium]|nr:hypothetical protein [Bacillota bacterium]